MRFYRLPTSEVIDLDEVMVVLAVRQVGEKGFNGSSFSVVFRGAEPYQLSVVVTRDEGESAQECRARAVQYRELLISELMSTEMKRAGLPERSVDDVIADLAEGLIEDVDRSRTDRQHIEGEADGRRAELLLSVNGTIMVCCPMCGTAMCRVADSGSQTMPWASLAAPFKCPYRGCVNWNKRVAVQLPPAIVRPYQKENDHG